MQLDFTDQERYDLDVPVANTIVEPDDAQKRLAGYAAVLTSDKPEQRLQTMLEEFRYTGESKNYDAAMSQLQAEKNQQLKGGMANILYAKDLTTDQKRAAVLYYQQNLDLPPELKEEFSVRAAAVNPDLQGMAEDFAAGFIEREQRIQEAQTEINAEGANWSGSTLGGIAGFLLEIFPFAGPAFKGYQFAEMQKAVDQKDYSTLSMLWKGILQGDAEEKLRKTIAAIPTTEGKRQAVKRLLATIRDMPGTDYNKYTAMMSSLDGEQEDWMKTTSNVLGVVGAVFGAAVIGKVAIKASGAKVIPTVNPDTMLGRAASHNPSMAGTMAGKAVVDETGDLSVAIGAKREEIIGDIVPKPGDVTPPAMNVEFTSSFKRELEGVDEAGRNAMALTARSSILYDNEMMDTLSDTIQTTIKGTKSAAVHLGKSTFNVTGNSLHGMAVFGKTETTAFQSYAEAMAVAKELAPELPEGAIQIVKPGRGGKMRPAYETTKTKGDHYLQFQYAKTVTPQDIVLYGPDAVRIRFDLFGREVKSISELLTKVALSGGKVGNYLFAHHAMPAKAASAAFVAFDKALAVEEPFITYARRYVAHQSPATRRAVSELLKEGEEFKEGGVLGKVFTPEEVMKKSLAKGLSNSEAEEVMKGYYVYRRIADWMYTLSDRSKSRELRSKGYSWITPAKGERFAGKPVSLTEVEDVRMVLNKLTGNLEPVSPAEIAHLYKQGQTLVRMAYPFRQGDTRVDFAKVGTSFKDEVLESGALPYIRGYVPRGYENAYFVGRTPLKVEVNGKQATGGLEEFRTTHYATDSLEDAKRKVAELQKADPTGKYDVKRERLSEKTVLDEADIFRQAMVHSSRRGPEVLEGGTLKDPLESLMGMIQSVSKKSAMEDFLQATKADFLRQYGEFTNYKFPTSLSDIVSKKGMTMDESLRLKQARAVYNWLEGMMIMQRYDSGLWQDVWYGAAEFAEKFAPVLSGMLRGLGNHYPLDYLRKISTAMFISLRPARQLLLQPSQLMLYSAIDPKLLNPVEAVKFFNQIGALGFSKFYKNNSKVGDAIPDELAVKVGAKLFSQSEKEFEETMKAFKNSGLLQSVDSNMLVDGLYSQKHKKLVESFGDRVSRNVGATVGFLPRLGRQLGFDRGEEINLAGSWIIARDRFMKMNPGIDPNTGAAAEQITDTARQLAFSMTRPGAFQYQKNALALPLQFIAAPHKALLNIFTSKALTAEEKARLMAAHFVLYGSAGLGIQKIVTGDNGIVPRSEYGDILGEEFFLAMDGGIADWGVNKLANVFLDEEGEKTRIDISGSFSPLSGGILPFGQFLTTLMEDPIAVGIMGPSWHIVDPQKGRLVTAIRDISASFRGGKEITPENFKEAVARAAEITSGGTDWMKYRFARDLDILVASSGHPIDMGVTAAETVGKLLGVGTIREKAIYEGLKRFKSEQKEMEDAVKYIYDGFQKRSGMYRNDPESYRKFNEDVNWYLSTIQDPMLRYNMQKEFRKFTNRMLQTTGESFATNLYYGAASVSAENLEKQFKYLESYGLTEQSRTIKNMVGEEQ